MSAANPVGAGSRYARLIDLIFAFLAEQAPAPRALRLSSGLSRDLGDIVQFDDNAPSAPGLARRALAHCTATPLRVLDFGCGEGQHRPMWERLGCAWTGLDYADSSDPTTVKRKERNAGGVVEYDGLHVPFPDQSFACVSAWQSLEHVQDAAVTFAEIGRILQPGGVFCGSVSYLEPFHAMSTFGYSPYGFSLMCRRIGCELKEIHMGVDGLSLVLRRMVMMLGIEETPADRAAIFGKSSYLFAKFREWAGREGLSDRQLATGLLQIAGTFRFVATKA